MEYIKGFLLVLSFFTRIPLGIYIEYSDELYAKGCATFPFSGLVTGLLLLVVYKLLGGVVGFGISILVFIAYLMITGGIHMDGLSDSFDGLFSGREKEKILDIMKDSRAGTFGVLSIVISTIVYIYALSDVDAWGILFFPFIGKAVGYTISSVTEYARPSGMGKVFVDNANKIIAFLYFLLFLGLFGLIWTFSFSFSFYSFLIGLIGAYISGAMFGAISVSRIGGLTGDTIGMIIEISQMVFLFIVAL